MDQPENDPKPAPLEQKKGSWRGRPRKKEFKEAIARMVEDEFPTLPPTSPFDSNSPLSHKAPDNALVNYGLTDYVCWLVFVGRRPEQIGQKLGVSKETVQRLVQTPYFKALYESKLDTMRGMVDQKARERVQEIVMEAIEFLYDAMTGKTHDRVAMPQRIEIAKYFHTLGQKMLTTGAGGPSDIIKAIYEKSVTRKNADGTQTTIRAVLQGSPQAVSPHAHDLEASGEGFGSEHPAGSESREERPTQTEESAGGARSNEGNDSTGS